MGSFNLYIIDFLELVNRADIPTIATQVTKWLDPIARSAGFSNAWVAFPQQFVVTPQPHEILVYICSYELSVVQFAPGAAGQVPDPLTSPHKGVTWLGPPAASEVYLKESAPLAIAALIFHEAMHNKLQMNNSMHNAFPPCAMSCASMTIGPGLGPTAAESQAMASALPKPVPQWTDGQQMMLRAVKNRGIDELWYLDLTYKR
jgi:hypothetical protein